MEHSNVSTLESATSHDPLMAALVSGARRMLAVALEAEADQYLEYYKERVDEQGRRLVTRNGYAPERELQTGLGAIPVKRPKVRFRGEKNQAPEVSFSSQLLPPYLKRTKNIEEMIPWLYLRGISTGDFPQALQALLGENAKGLSSTNITRLKQAWMSEYQDWNHRSLEGKEYVYLWADGVHFKIRLTGERQCILVILGVTIEGKKELVGVLDGVRESELSWTELLVSLKNRGMKPPKLAIGDGALGFWKALHKVFPTTKAQRCWVHKMRNILNKLPKALHSHAKEALAQIFLAESKACAEDAIKSFKEIYGAKYPRAIDCLMSSIDELLTFYDFPAEHWMSIRTTNPIESSFATVRLRTKRTKGSGSAIACLTMVHRLLLCAEKNWRKLKGYRLLIDVQNEVVFVDGVRKVA